MKHLKPFNLEDALAGVENLMSIDNLLSWSEEYEPNEIIRYNHILADSPIGEFSLEWKGWKENDDVAIYLDGYYLNSENTLEEAKEAVDNYLYSKTVQLIGLFTRKEMTNETI